MANANLTLRKSDYSAYGIEYRDDVRHEIFRGTAAALVAAELIESHQIPGQPGTGKTMAGYLPNGTRVKQGSSATTVPGSRHTYKTGNKFVIVRRFDDAEVSRREACYAAVWRKENETKNTEAAWRLMRDGIAKCCFGGLRLVWQTEV